jgi:hypothetical protein
MNDLTWFIYIVELVGRIPVAMALSGILLAFMWFILPPKGCEMFGLDHYSPFMGFERVKVAMYVWLVFLAISFLIPSRETIYLMAGSEFGEVVVNTPEAKEILGDIHEVIRHQLNELKGKQE